MAIVGFAGKEWGEMSGFKMILKLAFSGLAFSMGLERWMQDITYTGSSKVIEELNSHVLWPSLLFSQLLVWESGTACCTGQRKRLGRNAPEHPSLIEPKDSKQDTNGST